MAFAPAAMRLRARRTGLGVKNLPKLGKLLIAAR